MKRIKSVIVSPKRTKTSLQSPKRPPESEFSGVAESFSDEFLTENEDNLESEDENTDEDENDTPVTDIPVQWTDTSKKTHKFKLLRSSELLQEIPGNREPIDYFRAIFDDDILSLIVNETNSYAEELFLSEGVSEKSRITRWKPVTCAEMLTFIGLVLHTGTIKLTRLHDYWKSHPLFNITCFSKRMSRDRFFVIMRCLHFTKDLPEQKVHEDELYKIRPIVDFFNDKMSKLYYPGKELILDESMMLCQGRLVFRQLINNKKQQHSIKVYMLTEPNGVILKSLVYPAKGDKNLITHVVLDLLENYLDSGHSVYLDSFYNSYDLVDILTCRETYCTGLLNPRSRNNPKHIVMMKLRKGETASAYSNGITVGRWKGKRDLLYITNEHRNQTIEFFDQRNRRGEKPTPLFYYDRYMCGVDQQDQLNSYYPCDRKSLIWYKKLGIHFIYLMLINSYLLYKKYKGKNMNLHDFRISVLEQLLRIEEKKVAKMKGPKEHYLTKIKPANVKGATKRKRCKVCYEKKIRKMTLYHCEKCPQQPGFCVGLCFDIFHSRN